MAIFKKYSSYLAVSAIIIVSLIFSWPFFRNGIFISDDGLWAVVRLSEMVREIQNLQFPPRWSDFLNHGFGYPLFNFTYPFPFYLGALLKLFGFSSVASIKILFISSVLLSGMLMYLFLRKISSPGGALIGTLFYITAPYRLIDLYVRGSLGESLSFILFPLIFYLSVLVFEKKSTRFSTMLTLSLAVMFLTHNIMALFLIPVWLIFIVFLLLSLKKPERKKTIFIFLNVFLLAAGLAAYFILPALFEKKYIYLSREKLADQLLYFYDPVKFINTLTLPAISAVLFSIFVFLYKKIRITFLTGKIYIFSLAMFIAASLLTQKSSYFFWQFPPLSSVDFPWRIMGLVVFFSSILAGFLSKSRFVFFIGIILVLLNIGNNFRLIRPEGFMVKDDSYFFTNDDTTTSKDELMPVWVREKPKQRYLNKAEVIKGNAEIKELKFNSKTIKFRILAKTPGLIEINTVFFPGWEIIGNGKAVEIDYHNPGGLIRFPFNYGETEISGKFRETPVRLFSDIISLSSVVYIVSRLFKNKNNHV